MSSRALQSHRKIETTGSEYRQGFSKQRIGTMFQDNKGLEQIHRNRTATRDTRLQTSCQSRASEIDVRSVVCEIGDARNSMDQRKTARRTEGVSAVRSRDSEEIGYTYNVLMRIHVYPEAILFAFPQYANSVIHKVIVIDPAGRSSVRGSGVEQLNGALRSSMLKRFPGDWIA